MEETLSGLGAKDRGDSTKPAWVIDLKEGPADRVAILRARNGALFTRGAQEGIGLRDVHSSHLETCSQDDLLNSAEKWASVPEDSEERSALQRLADKLEGLTISDTDMLEVPDFEKDALIHLVDTGLVRLTETPDASVLKLTVFGQAALNKLNREA